MQRRRDFLTTVAAGLSAGLVAGCSSSGDAGTTREYPTYSDVPESVTTYLSETSNFDGTGVDRRDAETVTVTVGARGNGGNYAFDPAVVAISQGTTVLWEWNGQGGYHNVVSADDRDPLDSGSPVSSRTETYAYTFQEAEAFRYVCTPHRMRGMKGAIIVE